MKFSVRLRNLDLAYGTVGVNQYKADFGVKCTDLSKLNMTLLSFFLA